MDTDEIFFYFIYNSVIKTFHMALCDADIVLWALNTSKKIIIGLQLIFAAVWYCFSIELNCIFNELDSNEFSWLCLSRFDDWWSSKDPEYTKSSLIWFIWPYLIIDDPEYPKMCLVWPDLTIDDPAKIQNSQNWVSIALFDHTRLLMIQNIQEVWLSVSNSLCYAIK